jgi:hypothetical protein
MSAYFYGSYIFSIYWPIYSFRNASFIYKATNHCSSLTVIDRTNNTYTSKTICELERVYVWRWAIQHRKDLLLKRYSNPETGLDDLEVKAPGFLYNSHIKVVRLSALRTGRLYPQKYPGTHFERLSRPRAHGLVGCLGKNPQWHERESIREPSDL